MGLTNFNFYALNAVRGYPIDDGALGEDDAGRPLPPGLLVDCRLRFPATAGRYAFVAALASTPGLVTAVFMAADEPARPLAAEATGVPAAVPIAAVTLPRPVEPGRHYAVEALYPGTGGWIVLGEGVEDPYTGRFSSVRQSQLLPRCARPYRPLPVPSIGKEFVAGPLTGLVKVLGGADIEVVAARRTIRDAAVDCLVIRLADDLNRNVLLLYAGPCAGRPESKTCPRPGLELINTVGPDCDGDVTIEFRNVVAAPFVAGGGITLDLGVGLADACPGPYVPDDQGRLPGEFADLCSAASLALSEASSAAAPSSGISESRQSQDCAGLPFGDDFDAAGLGPGWRLEIGIMGFAGEDSPEEVGSSVAAAAIDRAVALIDPSRRNVLIWDDCGYDSTLGLTCRTQLKIRTGLQMNGGLVINHHRIGVALRPHYHLLLANATDNSFELWYYNGTNLSRMVGAAMPLPWRILPGLWYEVTARTRLGATGKAVIEGTLRGVEQPGMPEADIALAVTNYLPADGKFGVGTNRADCLFSFFELEES